MANAIRALSMDAVQKAKSGLPGMPMGMADIATALWSRHLRFNPTNPKWTGRDRFILSNGHGSMLQYALLHLTGYDLSIDDLKAFRQLHSKTPGHPEVDVTPGVETTTGPLGQGIANGVGMALAEKMLANEFNREGFPVFDNRTYVFLGDGCMMEGISSEAFSLAGPMGLSKLIVLYDSNRISIEGSTDLAFRENVEERMKAFGFQTITVEDGTNLDAIGLAIEAAKADTERPSFITIKTEIGYGCPAKQGKASAHGEPLGVDNVKAMRETLGWPYEEPFFVPDEVYAHFAKLAEEKAETEAAWNVMFAAYCQEYPEMEALWEKYHSGVDADSLMNNEKLWLEQEKPEATRSLSGKMINLLKDEIPGMSGGSADLGPSNKTEMKGEGDFSAENPAGRNIHFGVRELAMAAIGNGIMLHGGLRAYVATFFVFSDYVKPMARLSALMGVPLTFVLTHDSIGVGEDGPTHEPIEQLAMLRAMPNLRVFRPCDATETSAAWLTAASSEKTPTALVLTRQNLAPITGSSREALKGGYVIDDCEGTPEVILIASGSEVELAVKAKAELEAEGTKVRVVSMPCMELFEEQSAEYREVVLPKAVRKRVAIEALSDFGWGKYVGLDGAYVCMKSFGASAPAAKLFEKFGFTVENVVNTVKAL